MPKATPRNLVLGRKMGAGELVFFGAPTSTDADKRELPQTDHSDGDAYTIVVEKGLRLQRQICHLVP